MAKLEIQEGDTLAGFEIPFFQSPNDIFGQGIPPHQLVIYLYFCRVGNQGAKIFPGMRKVAKMCTMDKGTVDRSIQSLVNAGWLRKKKQFDKKTGAKTSNLYYLEIPVDDEGVYAENVQGVVQGVHQGVYAEEVQGVRRKRTNKEPLKKSITNNKSMGIRTTPRETLDKRHKEGTEKYTEQKYGHIVKR